MRAKQKASPPALPKSDDDFCDLIASDYNPSPHPPAFPRETTFFNRRFQVEPVEQRNLQAIWIDFALVLAMLCWTDGNRNSA
jgi:hypothetical protein